MIPDAAVEAAAGLIVQGDMGDCECRRSPYDKHDVNPPCSTRRRAIRVARAALEAAAPHMEPTIKPRDVYRIQAMALREAFHEFPLETITAPDNAAVWMNRRADELDRKAERA